MDERRRYNRYKAVLEVEYDATNDVEIQSKTYTLNVSEGGVSIPLNKAIKPGKEINLRLRLPYEEREISAIGKIAWRQPIDRSLAPEENAGIEFLDMRPDDKLVLMDYIKDCSPA